MITEKGTVKTTCELNNKLYKELNRTSFILGIAFIVDGAVLLIGYVLTAVFDIRLDDTYELLLLMCSAMILMSGIILVAMLGMLNKTNGVNNKVEEIEFFDRHLMCFEYENGEHMATVKVYYNRIVKVKETKNYLFMYNTRATAMSVDKSKLSLDELNKIRSLLGRPIVGAKAQTPTPETQGNDPVFEELNINGSSAETQDQQKDK